MEAAAMPPPPSGVVPHLCVDDAAAAIAFYVKAFGAHEVFRQPADDGKRILHATLTINGGTLYLADDFPEFADGRRRAADPAGNSPVVLHLAVPDVDAAYQAALDAGATVEMPLDDMFWGDRYGKVRDPFGLSWSLSSPSRKPAA